MKHCFKFLVLSYITISCSSQKQIVINENTAIKYIGEYKVSSIKSFKQTTVGGLSGIDYDARNDVYYLISDDRSDINPARFYTAKIYLNAAGIDSVDFLSVEYLRQATGEAYPGIKQNPFRVPDPEAIRFNAKTRQLVWCDEGERLLNNDTVVLINPSVVTMNQSGAYIDSFELPPNMQMKPMLCGPRKNGTFEGLSFTNNFKSLFVSVEEPLYEDGPRAGLNDSAAWIRIIKFDTKTRKPVGQYGYQIDPVAFPPVPSDAFKVSGVSEILAINNHQLLVLERSYSTGRKSSTIKLYLANLNRAEDISMHKSLPSIFFQPAQKKLLLNLDALGIYTDNIEGLTFGPRLPDGRFTLILVSDNNFSPDALTQFLLFTID